MTWHGIHGHDDVVEQFRRALARGRLASSFLFVGPEGIGKRAFALTLAGALLCRTRPEDAMDPCGQCSGCLQAAAGSHPDLDLVEKPAERSFIPLELLVGDKEHRRREGLCHRIALRPHMGGRKIAVIDDADYLNAEGANSLLKTLEEPPPGSVLILIGTSPAKQLPTIRSRCQTIRFRPLPPEVLAELLIAQGLAQDADEARRLAGHSEGSPQRARQLADPGLWAFRGELFGQLARPRLDSLGLARSVAELVDAAGRQPAARRQRLREVVQFAAEFYRQLLRAQSGIAPAGDAELQRLVAQAQRHRPQPQAADALDRCLEVARQIDRNANQATLIEAWLDDLAALLG